MAMNQSLIRGLANRVKVDESHEVPYLGGVSKDGSTIYIDYRFPKHYKQSDGKVVEPHKYLVFHEFAEFIHLAQGEKYNPAHRKAAQMEKEFLKEDGVDIQEYYEHVYEYVQKAMHNIDKSRIPSNLDMRPYIEDGLAPTLQAMGHPNKVKHPHSATHAFLEQEMEKDIKL